MPAATEGGLRDWRLLIWRLELPNAEGQQPPGRLFFVAEVIVERLPHLDIDIRDVV